MTSSCLDSTGTGWQSCGAEGEQDVDGIAQPRGNAEWPGGLLERGERLSFRDAHGQAFEALGNGLHLDVRRRQPAASRRDAGRRVISLRSGTAQAQKAPPWRCPALFRLRSCRESRIWKVPTLQIRIFEKTPAPPGGRVFLLGRHGRLLSAGDRQSFSTKPGSLHGYGLLLWYFHQDRGDACIADRGRCGGSEAATTPHDR